MAKETDWKPVPKSALKWLFGEGPDAEGRWFGDATYGHSGKFWWRSVFHAMLAASPIPPDAGVKEARFTVAVALAGAKGAQGGLSEDDFTLAHPNSLLGQAWRDAETALSALAPVRVTGEVHPDDLAVDRFAEAMKAKLRWEREERGRGGWDDPERCSTEYLAALLIEHLKKGNPGTFEDVANFAMMLHQRGAHPSELARLATSPEREALEALVRDLDTLISESRGVDGLHLNGDVAEWDALTEGGQFEDWLASLDRARAAIRGGE